MLSFGDVYKEANGVEGKLGRSRLYRGSFGLMFESSIPFTDRVVQYVLLDS